MAVEVVRLDLSFSRLSYNGLPILQAGVGAGSPAVTCTSKTKFWTVRYRPRFVHSEDMVFEFSRGDYASVIRSIEADLCK